MNLSNLVIPEGKTFAARTEPFHELLQADFELFINVPGVLSKFKHTKVVEGAHFTCGNGWTKDMASNGQRQLKCKTCSSRLNWKHFAQDVYEFIKFHQEATTPIVLETPMQAKRAKTFQVQRDNAMDIETGSPFITQVVRRETSERYEPNDSFKELSKSITEQVMTQIQIIMPQQVANVIEKYFENERIEKQKMREQYMEMKSAMDKMNEQLNLINEKVNEKGNNEKQNDKTTPTMAQVVADGVPKQIEQPKTAQQETTVVKATNQTLEEMRDDMSDISETTRTNIEKESRSDKERNFKIAALKEARKMNKVNKRVKGPVRESIMEFDTIYVSRLERRSYRNMKTLIEGIGADLSKVKRMTWVALSTIEFWVDKSYKSDLMRIFNGVGWNVRETMEIEKCRTDDAPDEVKHNQFQKAARHYGTLLYDCRMIIKDQYYEEGLTKFIQGKGQRFVDAVMLQIKDFETKANQMETTIVDSNTLNNNQANQQRTDAADTQAEACRQ